MRPPRRRPKPAPDDPPCPDKSAWDYANLIYDVGKEVMICEAGMSVADAIPCRDFLRDLISKTKGVPGGLGVFYWEPQAYSNYQGYTMGAFDTNGRPTVAMDAFLH